MSGKDILNLRKIEKKESRGRIILKEVARKRSLSGRLGTFVQKSFGVARKGITRSLYERTNLKQARINKAMSGGKERLVRLENGEYVLLKGDKIGNINSSSIGGINKVRRGRPRGTYNSLYAPYGGVYGYRKAMAFERYKQKIQLQQQSAFAPQNLARLRQIQMQDQMQRMSPERRTIPNTSGSIFLGGINQEIDDATNLVP